MGLTMKRLDRAIGLVAGMFIAQTTLTWAANRQEPNHFTDEKQAFQYAMKVVLRQDAILLPPALSLLYSQHIDVFR